MSKGIITALSLIASFLLQTAVLPAFGVVSELIATFTRRRPFGYAFIGFSSFAIAVIGFGLVGCVHLNDSVGALGSRKDRHANLGEGLLGVEPFRRLLAEPEAAPQNGAGVADGPLPMTLEQLDVVIQRLKEASERLPAPAAGG